MPAPVAIGLMLCDRVIYEEETRNATLVNIFSTITVNGFPSQPVAFTIFAVLTDGLGDVTINVTITRLGAETTVFNRSQRARFRDPFSEVRLRCPVDDFIVTEPGTFLVTILGDGQWVAHRRFQVIEGEVENG